MHFGTCQKCHYCQNVTVGVVTIGGHICTETKYHAVTWVVKMHEGGAATKNFCLDNHHTGLEPSVGMQYEYVNIIFIITIGLVHFFH